jgi:hypothetical protein
VKARPDAMNEPHENLDPDPFAHDASRRPSRLRRTIVRQARPRCARKVVLAKRLKRRQLRPCPHTDRGPLR